MTPVRPLRKLPENTEIIRQYVIKHSQKECEEHFGVSIQSIHTCLKKRGYKLIKMWVKIG